MDEQSINPAKLPWPADNVGMTVRLKREGCRAIGRMGGDEANLEIVMQVLRILAVHAKAKLQDQRIQSAAAVERLAANRVHRDEANTARVHAEENSLLSQRDSADRRLKALAKRKEEAIVRAEERDARRKSVLGQKAALAELRREQAGIGGAQS